MDGDNLPARPTLTIGMPYKLPVAFLIVTKVHIPLESHLSEYVVAVWEISTGQKNEVSGCGWRVARK